jgi:restriction system protein
MDAIIIIIVLVFIGVVLAIISNSKSKEDPIAAQERFTKEIIEENKQEIIDFIKPYVKQLSIKEEQLIYRDDYGDYIFDDWFSEQNKFVEKKMSLILFDLTSKANKIFDNTISLDNYKKSFRNDIRKYIKDDIIRSIGLIMDDLISDYHNQKFNNNYSFAYNTDDPILFEKSVAKNFELYGWTTNETKKTGDQGADVIAEKDGTKIIVQCKLYSRPIGNKAVQEVVAAKNYYKGNLSIVVSNSSYTKSAQQLADSNGVVLIHYSNLSEILEKL